MKLDLVEEREFPLLNRKQMKFSLDYDTVTPKNEEVKKIVVDNLKLDGNVVVIKKINPFFGKNNASILVYVYKSSEDIEKYDKIHKKVKKDGKKEETKKQDSK